MIQFEKNKFRALRPSEQMNKNIIDSKRLEKHEKEWNIIVENKIIVECDVYRVHCCRFSIHFPILFAIRNSTFIRIHFEML